MAQLKVYIEVDTAMDVPLAGVSADTRDYDVQQHRPEVLAAIQERLDRAFGEGNHRLVSFEFGLAGGEPAGNVPESGAR